MTWTICRSLWPPFVMMSNMTVSTTGIMWWPSHPSARCMARSTYKRTSTQLKPSNFLISTSMTSLAVSSLAPKYSWSRKGLCSQYCSPIWLLWSNWETSSRSTWTSSRSRRAKTENSLLTQPLLKPPRCRNNWSLVWPSTLATSVHLLGLTKSALSGLIFCSTSSLTKEIWRRRSSLTSPWCVIELPPTSPEDRLGSSNLLSCQFSSNWETSAQRSTPCN